MENEPIAPGIELDVTEKVLSHEDGKLLIMSEGSN